MASPGRGYGGSLDDQLPGKAKGLPLTLVEYWEWVPVGDPVGWWQYDVDRDCAETLRARLAKTGPE